MPDSNGWPTGADLVAFLLTGTGINARPSTMTQQIADDEVAASIERFTRVSGFYPFVGAQQTRQFGPQGADVSPTGPFYPLIFQGGSRWLDLAGGIISTDGLTVTVGNIGGGGTPRTLTLGTDFYLRPSNAPAMGQPYTSLEFLTAPYALPNSITITALWGWQAGPVSALYRNAVLADAAVQMSPQVVITRSGLLVEYREADVMERYNDDPFGNLIPIWQGKMARALASLRVQRVGGVF